MKAVIIATLAATFVATSAHAQSATTSPTSAPSDAKRVACLAKAYHKWQPPHAAGDVSPVTGQPYRRASRGVCRLDVRRIRAAITAGTITEQR